MKYLYPDKKWYTDISELKHASPLCPYANVSRCPRYYSSIYLLGKAGISTKIDSDTIIKLDKFWQNSTLIPVVLEHDTGVMGSNGKKTSFTNFCPEISYDIFGLFAISLHRYADEIDSNTAHAKLSKSSYPKDWRWQWSHVDPLHYIECPLYSQLLSNPITDSVKTLSEQEMQELIEVKPSFCGVSLNIKVLITRLISWFTSKQR